MISFLHTSDIHIATFDALRDRLAPELAVRHVVRQDLLALAIAQGGVTPELEAATRIAFKDALTPESKVLVCTCSTLGPVAEAYDADASIPVLRIDRPMADQAVLRSKQIAVCGALATAVMATKALVQSSADYLQRDKVIVIDHLFPLAWKYLERGDIAAYHQEIARGLRGAALTADLILLAQASMQGAIALCGDIAVPIWSSPEIGFRTALSLAQNMEKMQ